ncbi:hypothetical protein C6Q08_02760 [Burkholderia multivorans]|nr:hypothetical protein C6Q08_02760 [Burkholderia multivorans]PRG87507.1 hypothetical protein C6V04_26450 [Burkholderia multivorans]PRH19024.1 hypothetical protein C6T56_16700 [Burkholderia multivorans]
MGKGSGRQATRAMPDARSRSYFPAFRYLCNDPMCYMNADVARPPPGFHPVKTNRSALTEPAADAKAG